MFTGFGKEVFSQVLEKGSYFVLSRQTLLDHSIHLHCPLVSRGCLSQERDSAQSLLVGCGHRGKLHPQAFPVLDFPDGGPPLFQPPVFPGITHPDMLARLGALAEHTTCVSAFPRTHVLPVCTCSRAELPSQLTIPNSRAANQSSMACVLIKENNSC